MPTNKMFVDTCNKEEEAFLEMHKKTLLNL